MGKIFVFSMVYVLNQLFFWAQQNLRTLPLNAPMVTGLA